jgi:hypothetical protein
MTFDEFEFHCGEFLQTDENELISAYSAIKCNSQLQEMIALRERFKSFLTTDDSPRISTLYQILNLSILVSENGFSRESEVYALNIWNKLTIQKEWYLNDLTLLNNILFYFPEAELLDIVDVVVQRLKDYPSYKDAEILKTSLLINLSSIYIEHVQLDKCEKVLNIALENAKKVRRYDFLAVCIVRLGVCQKDTQMIRDGLQLCEIVGDIGLKEALESEMVL